MTIQIAIVFFIIISVGNVLIGIYDKSRYLIITGILIGLMIIGFITTSGLSESDYKCKFKQYELVC